MREGVGLWGFWSKESERETEGERKEEEKEGEGRRRKGGREQEGRNTALPTHM